MKARSSTRRTAPLELPSPAAAFLAFLLLLVPLPAGAQAIVGRVVDRTSQEPVPSAAVMILGADSTLRQLLTTDSAGRFAAGAAPGPFLLRVERLGYASVWSQPLQLSARDTADFLIQLPPQAVELAGVSAMSDGDWFNALDRRLDPHGFYDRMRSEWGMYLTPAEVDARKPTRVADLLTGFPGIIARHGTRGTIISANARMSRFREPGRSANACTPTVYVDARRMPPDVAAGTQGLHLEQVVDTQRIRGIEYYRDGTSAPPGFHAPATDRGTDCPVIVIWTYVGPER